MTTTPTLEEVIEALREAAQRSYNYFEPDNQPEYYNRWKAIVERYDTHPQGNGIAAALGDAASIRAAIAIETLSAQSVPDGWRPIETAPKDGTCILARYDNDCGYEYFTCWWTNDKEYPWASHDTAWPESRLDEWHPIPKSPAPTVKERA